MPDSSELVNRLAVEPDSKTKVDRLAAALATAIHLKKSMDDQNLTLPRTIRRLSDSLDAEKTLTIAGEAHTQADNDARLRAVTESLKLLERAGVIPAASNDGGSGDSITVNILNFNPVNRG